MHCTKKLKYVIIDLVKYIQRIAILVIKLLFAKTVIFLKKCGKITLTLNKTKMIDNKRIIGGTSAKLFDLREFKPEGFNLSKICGSFNIGSFKKYKKEDSIQISHSSHLVFVKTSGGDFVLKFRPLNTYREIIKEFALNNFLLEHRFPTPLMYPTIKNLPFAKTKTCLITCYKKIPGRPLYAYKLDENKIKKINQNIIWLNKLLFIFLKAKKKRLLEKENIIKRIILLQQDLRFLSPNDDSDIIENSLKRIYKFCLLESKALIRKPIHSNITLANMIYNGCEVFLLDLSHIRLDFQLNDLANLVTNCYLFDIKEKSVSFLIKDFFRQVNYRQRELKTVNNFIVLHLIRHYLKLIKIENKIRRFGMYHNFLAILKSEIVLEKKKIKKLIIKLTKTN